VKFVATVLILLVIRLEILILRHQLIPVFRQLDFFSDKGVLEKAGARTPQHGYKRARPAGNQNHEAVVVDFRRTCGARKTDDARTTGGAMRRLEG